MEVMIDRDVTIINVRNNIGSTILHYACEKKKIGVTPEVLIKHGADIHARNEFGFTPLHVSCTNGMTDISAFLIEHGADVNARSNKGFTPLHSSAKKSAQPLALIDMGADIHARAVSGDSPIQSCAPEDRNAWYAHVHARAVRLITHQL
jgi:ankyrin repeat protein